MKHIILRFQKTGGHQRCIMPDTAYERRWQGGSNHPEIVPSTERRWKTREGLKGGHIEHSRLLLPTEFGSSQRVSMCNSVQNAAPCNAMQSSSPICTDPMTPSSCVQMHSKRNQSSETSTTHNPLHRNTNARASTRLEARVTSWALSHFFALAACCRRASRAAVGIREDSSTCGGGSVWTRGASDT